ncbi:hypothetical protein IHE45_05G117200 [Dioscorea alata]|uniref:Uncharacterized protein n=1 Tax=Dioscorea alata TaxID=55571 RepID=A0ACB7W4I8_DIOAL|nr:hypothetical protein IHE45_05G117200 [Dioscorea alata]
MSGSAPSYEASVLKAQVSGELPKELQSLFSPPAHRTREPTLPEWKVVCLVSN